MGVPPYIRVQSLRVRGLYGGTPYIRVQSLRVRGLYGGYMRVDHAHGVDISNR